MHSTFAIVKRLICMNNIKATLLIRLAETALYIESSHKTKSWIDRSEMRCSYEF